MKILRNILVLIMGFLVFFPAECIAASLLVSWKANTDTDLAGYMVYYGTRSGYYSTGINAGKATSYQISGVQNGTTYYVAVSAYDSSQNESLLSVEQTVTVPAAVQSTGITLVSPAIGATVYGNPVFSWAGKGFSTYKAYISLDGKKFTRIYSGSSTSCSMQQSLWSLFVPSRTTITWYVEGITGSKSVKSATGRFIKG
jgi:hypothetical protein